MGVVRSPIAWYARSRVGVHADFEPVNLSDEEWRIRKTKRTRQMAVYERNWPFAWALASLLQTHGDGFELTRSERTRKQKREKTTNGVLLWPSAENRNVSKRMWESQAMAARHCLDGNTMLYFKFWVLCTQPDGRFIVG